MDAFQKKKVRKLWTLTCGPKPNGKMWSSGETTFGKFQPREVEGEHMNIIFGGGGVRWIGPGGG